MLATWEVLLAAWFSCVKFHGPAELIMNFNEFPLSKYGRIYANDRPEKKVNID